MQHRFSTPLASFSSNVARHDALTFLLPVLPKLKASGKDDISCSGSTSCNMVLHLLKEKTNDVEPLIICNDVRA